MLTKLEAERIAASANALRPDWSVAGMIELLGDERIRNVRTYRDVALAMTAIAVDPDTLKPTRILEHGPWWETTRPIPTEHNGLMRVEPGISCTECYQLIEHPFHRRGHPLNDHEFTP